MNHLIFLDAQAGELEKILSGVKTMLVKEFDPAHPLAHPLNPGDSLYFLRTNECALRVKATLVRVLFFTNHPDENLSQTLKEMQPKLQLTEEQFNHWSTQKQVMLIKFDAAQKIPVIKIAPEKFKDRSNWIAFETFNLITE
jgi:hypothetical protein